MGTTDRYTDDLTIKLSSGKSLTIDADLVTFTGAISSSGALGNTVVTGTLSVSGVTTLAGSLIANGDITKASSLEIGATGGSSDLSLISGRDIILNPSDDISITPTNDYTLSTGGSIVSASTGTQAVKSDSTLTLTGAAGVGQGSITLNASGMFFSGTQDATYVADFSNSSTVVGSDVMRVRTLTESPVSSTRYMIFSSGVAQTTRGVIRSASSATDGAFLTEGVSGDSSAHGAASEVEVNVAGDCVFVSGSADYGEFIECGNLTEWPVDLKEGERYLGLPEGYIVYIRDKAFYKEGPGTPMVVSHRSIVVGNERVDETTVGQIVSFIGQVPVMVMGIVNSGDLIVPTGSHYAEAVSADNITFPQYMRAIGTAWESSDKEELKKVMCSVGVKNTY